MGRGGARRERDEPERRCVATGESGGKAGLIRFVLDPEGRVAPDLAERLPGRGVWLSSNRAAAEKAVKKRLFARGFKAPAEAVDDLPDLLERLLAARTVEALSLCRKAGLAVAGFEKARARLREGGVAALFAASDGAADGRAKLAAIRGDAPIVECLTADEIGAAFGRDATVHAAVAPGGAADRAIREAGRLDGFRQAR
ncbi:MAG: RNA-binding protein [Pseudomonadota bacterium]